MMNNRAELWQAFWDGWNSGKLDLVPYSDNDNGAMWYHGRNLRSVAGNEVERRYREGPSD